MGGELIYICGPDGVGKSTQAKLLIENIKKEGKTFEYRWLRFHHLFSLPLLGIARLMGLSEIQTLDDGEKIGYHYFYKSELISYFYPIFMLIDTSILTLFKIYVPIFIFKKNICCDRFIYDTVIDIMISTGKYDFHISKLGRTYLKLIPQRSRIVMLTADSKVLKNRRNDVYFDDTLNLKIAFYRRFAKEFKINEIDASKKILDVYIEIARYLNE